MAFLRNMFRRNEVPPESIAVRATNDSAPPMAFYLNGQGRMQAIKADGYISSGNYSTVGLGYMIRNQEQYARAAIASVWAANCISLRSDTMARLEWLVRDKKSKEPIEGHPFTVALENSKQNVIRLLEKRLLTYGEFFAKPLRNDDQFFSGFHVLNNLDVEVDTSQGFISEFQYNPQGVGQVFTFSPDDVVYIHTDNDFDDLRGLSKLEHVLLEIQIDRDISRTTAAFYRNDARPGVLLIPETNLTPKRADEVIAYWNAQFEGPDKTGRTVLMPETIKEVVDFQRAPALDDVELRESTRREVCAAFKVPLSMAGAWDDATYQSLPEQRMAFYEETIIPAAESNARDLTKFALPFFDDSRLTEVYFDAATILALVENRAEDVDIATRKLNSGAYTMNEMRASLGDEPVVGGDIHIMQSGWIPVQAGDLETFESPNTAQAPEEQEPLALPETTQPTAPTIEATPEMVSEKHIKKKKQPRDKLGRFGEGGGSSGGGDDDNGGGDDGDSGNGGGVSTKPPAWAKEKGRFTTQVDGVVDFGHMDNNPANVIGANITSEISTKQTDALSSSQKESATTYTGESYKKINGGLRSGEALSDENQRTVDGLDSAIAQSSLERPTMLYRGMKMNDSLRENIKPGATFSDAAYTSTSFDQANSERFSTGGDPGAVMRITAPAGQTGLATSSISEFSEENEFVLPRGTTYSVTGVSVDPDSGLTFIEAEIVPEAA